MPWVKVPKGGAPLAPAHRQPAAPARKKKRRVNKKTLANAFPQPASPDADHPPSQPAARTSSDRPPSPRQPVAPGSQPSASSGGWRESRSSASWREKRHRQAVAAKRPLQGDNSSSNAAAKRRRRKKAGDDDSRAAAAKERREKDFVVADDFDLLMNRLQQPAALSSTGDIVELDVPVPKIAEYQDAEERPIRKRELFEGGRGAGGSSHDLPALEGHDVMEHLLSWRTQPPRATMTPDGGQPAAPRPPAQYVCWHMMEAFKKAKKEFEDTIGATNAAEPIAQMSVRKIRADTVNWQRELQGPNYRLRRRPEVERACEISAVLREHEGEARVWQLEREEWHALWDESVLGTKPSVKVGNISGDKSSLGCLCVGSVWDQQCGISVRSVWDQCGISVGSVWDQCGISVGSV